MIASHGKFWLLAALVKCVIWRLSAYAFEGAKTENKIVDKSERTLTEVKRNNTSEKQEHNEM